MLTILLPTRLNPGAGRHVIRVVGSMRGASLPRRSWYGIAGAALLIASAAIHLDLYVTGYQSIPTIGWLAYGKDTEGNIFGMMQMDANAK